MKFYSVRLTNSNIVVCFSEYKDARRFTKELDFKNKFVIDENSFIETTEDGEIREISLEELKLSKHNIDILEVGEEGKFNFIYASICMSLNRKNHKKFGIEIYPILQRESLLELFDKSYYSIIRRDKEGNFKSKSEIYIDEYENRIKLELYIPVGRFTNYITGKVIAERLYKQIEKYRNIYFSNKYSKIKKFENQYNLLVKDLKNYFIEKEHGEQIIESALKLLEYTKERTKKFSDKNRLEAIKKIVEQIKGVESNSLFLLELISDLIREKKD